MPAVRTQQAEDLIPDTAQTSLPRVTTKTACPFPNCLSTASKPADLERHYLIHFPEWKPYQCPWYDMCRFASRQKYNVVVHLQTTNMHFERSAEEIAEAKPVQVLSDCCKPKLPRTHPPGTANDHSMNCVHKRPKPPRTHPRGTSDGRSMNRVHKRPTSNSDSTLATQGESVRGFVNVVP